jgi:hypothetical protein
MATAAAERLLQGLRVVIPNAGEIGYKLLQKKSRRDACDEGALYIYAGGVTSEGRILTRKSLLSVTVIGSMTFGRG